MQNFVGGRQPQGGDIRLSRYSPRRGDILRLSLRRGFGAYLGRATPKQAAEAPGL